MRDSDRTSTRLPPAAGRTRTTMSSSKPNQNVVSVASIRPAASSVSTSVQPISRTASSARSNAAGGGASSITGCTSGYASRCCAATASPA